MLEWDWMALCAIARRQWSVKGSSAGTRVIEMHKSILEDWYAQKLVKDCSQWPYVAILTYLKTYLVKMTWYPCLNAAWSGEIDRLWSFQQRRLLPHRIAHGWQANHDEILYHFCTHGEPTHQYRCYRAWKEVAPPHSRRGLPTLNGHNARLGLCQRTVRVNFLLNLIATAYPNGSDSLGEA